LGIILSHFPPDFKVTPLAGKKVPTL